MSGEFNVGDLVYTIGPRGYLNVNHIDHIGIYSNHKRKYFDDCRDKIEGPYYKTRLLAEEAAKEYRICACREDIRYYTKQLASCESKLKGLEEL